MQRKHLLPVFIFLLFLGWAITITITAQWSLFSKNWPMSLTMVFGSFIAGATSEGGGAVAFPVMTLFFKIAPSIARDFSLMIQSFGMSVAAAAIILYRQKVVTSILTLASFGGALGMIVGLVWFNQAFAAPFLKMFFTSFWLSFCFVLFQDKHQDHADEISPAHLPREKKYIFLVSLLGGFFSSQLGTGLDILVFSFLVLRLKISPKVATPTSVVLMGVNSLFGFLTRLLYETPPISLEAWTFLKVCIPVVIIGAPLGALFISQRSKEFIEKLLIVSIVTQFLASLYIIEQSTPLLVFSGLTFLAGSLLFYFLKKSSPLKVS